MKLGIIGLTLAVLGLGAPGMAAAQMTGHDAGSHAAHMNTTEPALLEPGQGAFAALSEIVRVLQADPETDWATVNITALRDHLIDMDILVRDAVVSMESLPNGLRSVVTGDAKSMATATRMVPAHAAELQKDPAWTVTATVEPDRVILIVTSDDPATQLRINALGFYGLMASQDHHRAHHYAIARGVDVHGQH
jgi:hypothetical protein